MGGPEVLAAHFLGDVLLEGRENVLETLLALRLGNHGLVVVGDAQVDPVAAAGEVDLAAGLEVVEHSHPGAGRHEVRWDGRDDRGRDCATGVYLARLVVDGRQASTHKLTLVR